MRLGNPNGAAALRPSRATIRRNADRHAWDLAPVIDDDHITGEHMRHGTRLLRWRTDKPPESCTMDQIR